ncbi:MAG TPA: hypothetical protein VFT22_42375 [Kofleriaceae bacterium]|nr:hypothetical protein [Kofleriaceae bacterium]
MHVTRSIATAPALHAGALASVTTSMMIDASRGRIWARLMFYEQIDERPPLHLRLLLPVPLATEGEKSEVGDEVRCHYEGGHLIKRITHIDPHQRYAFEIIEQALVVGGGLRLSGGEYALRDLGAGRTELSIVTRYVSPRRPRWLWLPIERWVCHSFHRHILRAMRRGVEATPRLP